MPCVVACGLKFWCSAGSDCTWRHAPRRGMWIEICGIHFLRQKRQVMPRVGACGLKFWTFGRVVRFTRVMPRVGACGLKWLSGTICWVSLLSCLVLEACGLKYFLLEVAALDCSVMPHIGHADWNIWASLVAAPWLGHAPRRDMWIEIMLRLMVPYALAVMPYIWACGLK